MARIRNVKPQFFRHEGLQELESANPGNHCMLVFIGLWGQCDTKGRFEWKPRQLKLDILPFLNFDMKETLALLESAGVLFKYDVDGTSYGCIPSFPKHQRFSGKEAEGGERFPAPRNLASVYDGVSDVGAIGKAEGSDGEAIVKQPGSAQLPRKEGREREWNRELEREVGVGSVHAAHANTPAINSAMSDGEDDEAPVEDVESVPERSFQDVEPHDTLADATEPHGALIPFPIPPAASRGPVRAAGPPSAGNDVEAAVEAFRRIGAELGWARPSLIEGARRSNVAARLKEHGLDGWLQALAHAKDSAFLRGETHAQGRSPFRMTLDWFANKTNFLKVIEGNYDGQASNGVGGITGHYIASRLEHSDEGATARDHFK